ncbi:MAG: glycosyltransferase family 4 protein [Chitinophagia bacterium]|jgi:glycosyltransferase involved in cell wall biosynthesis
MHILIVSQYFWPETFGINDTALGLKDQGHEVSVLTGIPNYPEGKFYPGYSFFKISKEKWNGITIYRSRLFPRGQNNSIFLSLNYLSFALFGTSKVLRRRKRYDRILVYQVSPVFLIIPALVAKWRFRVPLVIQVMDLWPETLASTPQGKNPQLIKWVGRISDYLYRKADRLLLPFKSSQPILEKRGIALNKMSYLPNSVDGFYKPVSPDPQFDHLFTGEIHFLLAGNLGESQGLDLIINAADILKEKYPNIRWLLVGEGRSKHYLENLVKERELSSIVIFPGRFPSTVIPSLIARADATLLTLRKEPIFAITVPNRLQSYLACGKPILASIDGEAASIISEANSGLVAPAGDLQLFVENVEKFIQSTSEEKETWGHNARNFFLQNFERGQILKQLNTLLQEVGNSQ